MRTNTTINLFAQIAIVTENLVPFRVSILFQPQIENPTDPHFFTVLPTTAFHVVNT